MANIPGATNVLPGVFTDVITQSRGVSVPGGSRLAAMIGEGTTDQTLVSQAQGGGLDGLNSTYTSTSGADGRHFLLQSAPIISNRTTLFKNGVPLVGLEATIDNLPFSNAYDYKIDITTGQIELQSGHLKDQGGSDWTALSTNVGDGYVSNLSLVDTNAFPETWTIRCVSVQRDAMSNPISGTAKFLAYGSISGAKLDINGNPIIWVSNGQTVSNGILQFAIYDGATVFREGDGLTVIVESGVLVRNDSLTANYIPVANLNDPVLNLGMNDVVNRHGFPSLTNNLSLGAQLTFANNSPSLISVQAAPPLPRRTSYILEPDGVNSTSTNPDDYIFPLPIGVIPDFNSNIHFFVTNLTTNVETQILPNKLDYYLLDTAGQPTTNQFIFDAIPAPGGYSYFYTVVESLANMASGFDGYFTRNPAFRNQGTFASDSIVFDSTYLGKTLKIIDSANVANIMSYNVTAVSEGKLYAVAAAAFSDFVNDTGLTFQVIDPATGTAVAGGTGTDGVLVANVGLGTATLTSATINFGALSGIAGFRVQITGSASDDGLYDINSSGSFTVSIAKTVVTEHDLRFEVLDSTEVSNYIVVNQNVVPNGYRLRVSIVDDRDADFFDAGWINALESLEAVECDILVPLPKQTISVIFQNSLSHCLTMSNIRNKKERVLFIGAISGLKPENLSGAKAAAVEDIGILEGIQGETVTDILSGNIEDLTNYSVPDGFGNTYRAVYFYPDQIVVQAGSDNVLIDGFYLAAAAAGWECANVKIQDPLTNKVLTGFTILRNKMFSQQILESLANSGVTTLQPVAGGGRVVWGITTTQSGFPEEQEISIVFIRDRVAKNLRAGFAGFVGQAETPDTAAVLNTRAVILLNSFISQGLITAYKDLSVTRDTVDPTQWNIAVRVQPTYPINFIYIKIGVGQL